MIDGKGGNDLLIGGFGADAIEGGSGIDTADYRESGAQVLANLNAGVVGQSGDAAGDTLMNVENLIGSRYDDTLIGNTANNRLDPFQNVFFGIETLIGNGGIDTAVLNYAFDTTGAGYAVFLGQTGSGLVGRTPAGGSFSTTIGSLSTIEQIEFFGADGNDTVTSLATGNDLINTGGGNDSIFVLNGHDQVHAGADDDAVVRISSKTVAGGLYVGARQDLQQTYLLDGGAGIDSLLADISYTARSISWVGAAPGSGETGRVLSLEGGGVIRNFEILTGLVTGSGNDFIGQRGDVDNIFTTNGGSDTVIVGLGMDTADGGADERALTSVPQFAEIDTLIVDYSGQQGRVVNVDPLDPADAAFDGVIRLQELDGLAPATLAQVRHREFERIFLTGTAYDDHLVGSGANPNQTSGPAAGDVLDGGDGDDVIEGRAGNDTLIGGEGRDVLNGGDGDDILIGGARGGGFDDFDQLSGGLGADRFVLGDASGTFYDGPEDGAQIFDFNPGEGDVIQLAGGPGGYRLEVFDPIIFSDRALFPHVLYAVDPVTGSEQAILTILSTGPLDLGDAAFDFVPVSGLGAALGDVPLVLGADVVAAPELAGWLWQSGAVGDAALIASLQAGGTVSEEFVPLELTSSLGEDFTGPTSIIRAGDIGASTLDLIGTAIAHFAVPLLELDNDVRIYNSFEYEGDSAAAGVFFNMWGAKDGIVLSTGRVEDILGENTHDGRFTQGPRPASEVTLNFENLGTLEGGTLYRALVPNIPGGIESLVLQDDGDLTGGASGNFSAFDLDALFFSSDLITSTTGLTRADVNSLARLGVIDYTPLGIAFEPGYQRPGGTQSADMFGTVNGMIDFGQATLDTLDWNNQNAPSQATGFMSLGEGGAVALNLTGPVRSDASAPTYIYVYEIGGQENLEGIGRVSAQPIGVAGDLSTDLGTPGTEGDTTTLRSQFFVDYSGKQGPIPDFAQMSNVPFFDVVVVSEELPERGGADLPDLIAVRINGVDVLTDSTGAQVTMNTLALSPYGDYAEELSLNLVGEGALADYLKADSYTSVYRISGPVVNGMNEIEITVADRSDAFLDTAIFLMPLGDTAQINTAPVARNDLMVLNQRESGLINVITGDGIDTDQDGDALTVTGVKLFDDAGNALQDIAVGSSTVLNSGLGTVLLAEDGSFSFTAARGTNTLPADTLEVLTFSYVVSDGKGGADEAGLTVVINGLNDAPRALGDKVEIDEDESLTLDLTRLASDVDGDALTFSVAGAESGKASVMDGQLTYIPNANFFGTDQVNFTVLDGKGGRATETITITVNPVNDAPEAKDDDVRTLEDRTLVLRAVDLLANDSDVDGDVLQIIGASARFGTVKLDDGGGEVIPEKIELTYLPNRDYSGEDEITYLVSDGNGGVSKGTVFLTILPENDAPVAQNDVAGTGAGRPVVVDVLANDSDVDGDTIFVADIVPPAQGRVSLNANGGITYDPNGAFDTLPIGETALVSFSYTLSDGLLTDTATVAITISGAFDPLNITGTPEDDVLNGTEDDNNMFGLAGNDAINGLGGNDLIEGNGGADVLNGDAGDDRLEGGLGNDQLNGGADNDTLLGGAGNDALNGGAGVDFASFEASTARVIANLNLGTATGEGTDTLLNIEGLIGSAFNDRLVGDGGANTLFGGDGDDELIGLGGDDTLFGEGGNDILIGSGGDDVIFGGEGNDVIDGVGGADVLSGEAGDDTITGDVGVDLIDGGTGNDDIFGNFGVDTIFGGAGDDNIRADGSGDVVEGGDGNDRIVGGNGRDTLFGGRGNDVLFGGLGGAGGDGLRDVFVFKSAANGGGGFDIIRDFEDTVDKLDLSGSGYANFADVFADAAQVGANVEIDFDFGGILRINNFQLSDFTAGDVLF